MCRCLGFHTATICKDLVHKKEKRFVVDSAVVDAVAPADVVSPAVVVSCFRKFSETAIALGVFPD